MKFGNLQYLYLLWILPGMILLAVYSFRKKEQLLRIFADSNLWDRLMPEVQRRRQIFKFLLLFAGVCLLMISFLRPRWGFQWEEIKRKGVDILVAVDVSESMLAEDIKPNRLERAKRELIDLVNMLQGDRIGLIAFAGASFLECPLTLDHGAFKMFLDYLDTDLIPIPGTAIGEAIQTAIKSFLSGQRASKALILITDGEDHPGKAEKAAEAAKEKGIRIFTIGIGSEQGAPIPLRDGTGGFKKDRQGQMVLSKLQETTLQKIALATGGSYVRSVTGDMDLKKIYEEQICEKMEAGELNSTKRRRWEERFQWFLFAGILLFCLEALLPERKRPAKEKPARRRFLLWSRRLVILFSSLPGLFLLSLPPAAAESIYSKIHKGETLYEEKKYDEALTEFLDAQVERPGDILLKYNIGNTHFQMRNFTEAEEAFMSVANSYDPALQQSAYYNLGNCAYRQGKLEEAVNHYKHALELNSEDEDARFNLEFVRQEIKRRLEEAKKQEEQSQGKNCKNPQSQPTQQEGDQQENQSNASNQQGEPPSPEKDPSQEEAQPKPSEEGEEQPRPDEGPQQALQQQDKTGEKDSAGAEGQAVKGAEEMSREEAERWLNTLDEEQKELAKKQIKKALGTKSFRRDKDW